MNFLKRVTLVLSKALICGSTFLCVSSFAQESNILDTVSPKLRQFVITHPGALQLLTNTLSEAFNGRTVQLYYFYSEDKVAARAYHYYPSESVVGICIRENQEPSDEFACLIFEMLNSEGEKRFQEFYHKAESGDISKTNFAREMLNVEFVAVKSTGNLLHNLKFSKKEISESYYYKRFIECPDSFEDFISYSVKVSSHGDPIKEFETKYDSLRKP